ncbi:MAG TPA: MG2 domain-containing protein, partial [Bdellovibrionales bacterium]|nr:MG2 domain-containing protein [Bdellovibrionales bacterium]
MSNSQLRQLIVFMAVLVSAQPLSGADPKAAELTDFSPQGPVKKVQQAKARFSTDMVAMGDPRTQSDPFTIVCNQATKKNENYNEQNQPKTEAPKFTTRWADSRNWVLDFDDPLKAGMKCTFTLKAGVKDANGTVIKSAPAHSFSTSGPALLSIAPRYGELEPEQMLVALTDGEIDLSSLEKGAYFEVAGLPDKVRVRVVTGAQRDLVLPAALEHNWEWSSYRAYLQLKKPASQIEGLDNFIVLAPARRFPESAKVVLHWTKDIRSKSGLNVDEEQKFEFRVIDPFTVSFNCTRTAADKPCNPILDMSLNFSKRVPLAKLKGAKLVSATGQTWFPKELTDGDQNKNVETSVGTPKNRTGVALISNFEDKQVNSLTFTAPFPDSTKFKVHLPKDIRDELGRKLENQASFPLETATDEYSPLVKFPAKFGILELKADPVLPVSLRNVEKNIDSRQLSVDAKKFSLSGDASPQAVIDWYRKLMHKSDYDEHRAVPLLGPAIGSAFKVPKPMGEREFELVGIPLKQPGLHVVELASPRLGEALLSSKSTMYVATAALVTNLGVHFKMGREDSLVWVTSLHDGRPVQGAKVTVHNESGATLGTAETDASGLARFANSNFRNAHSELFAFARKDGDFSFVSSSWTDGIETYRFSVNHEYLRYDWGPIVAHTVLNRMAAQPGETVQMKHIVRDHTGRGFAMIKKDRLPKRALIVHSGTRKIYTFPLEFDEKSGVALTTFAIPKDANLGTYQILLSNKEKLPETENGENDPYDWSSLATGHFLVAEYRLPLMQATVKVLAEPLIRPAKITADLSANYLSGGPAKGLPVKLRAALAPGYFTPDVPGAGEFSFFSAPIKAGVDKSGARDTSARYENFTFSEALKLGPDGGLKTTITTLPPVTRIQELTVEMEYADPNGEIKTASATLPVFPSKYIVGLRSDSWFGTATQAAVLGVITDPRGKPVSNRAYTVEAYQTEYITHRKRLVGGFYSYDHRSQVKALGKVCEGKSDEQGRFKCAPEKLPFGHLTLQAKVSDEQGRATYANASVEIYEKGADHWWVPGDSDRIDIIPEKTRYEPGETAKFVVRTPFPKATALVTIEREGVLDSFITEVHRDNPVIQVPIKGNFAPNVFVSALLIRGRAEGPKPTALVDLARPSMKMGLAPINVGWKEHELLVGVKTDKQKYRTREKVQVDVNVKTATGAPLPEGAEVAIAAVDESLLRLKSNTSWSILREMMQPRGLAVESASAQSRVVGKRHFGSKAKPPGGGGGQMDAGTRELFDPILLWEPRVKVDSKGQAKATVTLNDSITSFRIVAVANAGANHFGDGKTTIQSSKDLIIYSGFAPLVREGDEIKNAYTVRNTTGKAMAVSLEITSKELKDIPAPKPFSLKPSEAVTMTIPVTVPHGLKELNYRVAAKGDGGAQDALAVKVRVEPAVPARVLQATLFQLDKSHSIPVQQPKDALPFKGGLRVSARASLSTGLAGVKSYMDEYIYSCLEQKVSRSIVLEDKAAVQNVINGLPAYLDGAGLLKFFPSSLCGDAQLSRYVLNILMENGYELPGFTRDSVLAGLESV